METVSVSLNVPKESFELAQAMGDLIVTLMAEAKDGFSGGDVLNAIIKNLDVIKHASEGLQNLPAEIKGNPGLFVIPFIVQAERILEAAKGAPVIETPPSV